MDEPIDHQHCPPNDPRWPFFSCIILLAAALSYLTYGPAIAGVDMVGWSALIAIPFATGGLFSVVFDPNGENSPMGCWVYPTIAFLTATALAYLFFGEGAVCIAMILPLWIPAAIGGSLMNRWLRWKRVKAEGDNNPLQLRTSAWVVLPVLAFATDALTPPQWNTHEVVRSVDIAAPADVVWPLLISIPSVQADEGIWNPTHDILGIPRPTDAELVRKATTLVRMARWGNNVRFEEHVTEFVPGHRIAWNFAFPDNSVQLHSDRHIAPHGATVKILAGGYHLEPISTNLTRVHLNTRYASRSRLDGYFSWWGDQILGDIQSNVLEIIRARAEAKICPPQSMCFKPTRR